MGNIDLSIPRGKTDDEPYWVDIDFSIIQQIETEYGVPEWRIPCKGLNLEGPCKNPKCEAFFGRTGQNVIVNIGFGNFDMKNDVFDQEIVKCPVKTCGKWVKTIVF